MTKKVNESKFIKQLIFGIAVIVVAIFALIGYTFMSQEQNSMNDAASEQLQLENAVGDNGWYLYTSPGGAYRVEIPDGWKLETNDDPNKPLYAWDSQDIVYTKGVRGVVEQVEAGRGGHSIAFSLMYAFSEHPGDYISPTMEKVAEYYTDSGVLVQKFEDTVNAEGDGWMGPPEGTKTYTYNLYNSNVRIFIQHDVLPGEKEQTVFIEKMIDSLEYL